MLAQILFRVAAEFRNSAAVLEERAYRGLGFALVAGFAD